MVINAGLLIWLRCRSLLWSGHRGQLVCVLF